MKPSFFSKLTLVSLFLFCLPAVVLAAPNPYVPLEPLPFLSQVQGTKLPDLLQALFQLLIIGGAGVAVLMITIGGIQYMTGEALHQKSEGRARIQNSVLGLILLLFIYLLLRTINPQLLNFNLSSIERVGDRSNAVVLQARATEAQRNATAATAGPASTASTNPGSTNSGGGAGSANSGSVCPPGDVFCGGGSGLGFNGGGGSNNSNPVLPGDYGDDGGFSGGTAVNAPSATYMSAFQFGDGTSNLSFPRYYPSLQECRSGSQATLAEQQDLRMTTDCQQM